jgi:uncharacterized protein YigA (DUF484 family)
MSRQTPESAPETPATDEQQVLDYLRANPALLRQHRELLAELDIPHDAGEGTTSLIEYQVAVLREETRDLSQRLEALLTVARDNDRLADQLHRFTLELLAAEDLEHVLVALRDGLRQEFRADVVQVILITDESLAAGVPTLAPDDPRSEQLEAHFPGDTPVLGNLDETLMALVFDDQAGDLASAAIIPMEEAPLRGFLAIGSRDADRYQEDQGTVFLGQLGALAARILRRSLTGTRA